MSGFRPNRKWTSSERRGYKTPAMERLEEERRKALQNKENKKS